MFRLKGHVTARLHREEDIDRCKNRRRQRAGSAGDLICSSFFVAVGFPYPHATEFPLCAALVGGEQQHRPRGACDGLPTDCLSDAQDFYDRRCR